MGRNGFSRAWEAMLVGIMLTGLSACSSTGLEGRPDLTIVRNGELPPPTTQDLIADERAYVIGPLDEITVDIYGVPDLSRSVQVDASGHIALPLIGSLEASGKNPRELAELVEGELRGRFVRDPQVTVNLTKTVSHVITVDGQVNAPGLYPVTGKMTLMRAIATAEGVAEFAQESHVVVFREVGDKQMAALYDLRAIRRGMYADPDVFANDIVLVGTDNASRIFNQILSTAPILAAPIVTTILQ